MPDDRLPPGPWEAVRYAGDIWHIADAEGNLILCGVPMAGPGTGLQVGWPILRAIGAIPEMVAELERLRSIRDRVLAAADVHRHAHPEPHYASQALLRIADDILEGGGAVGPSRGPDRD